MTSCAAGIQVQRQPRFEALAQCTQCPRLAGALAEVREVHTGYYARPVPAFGDEAPQLLVVGLAPGLHGANRTGRPFTGDYAGELLYGTLHGFGWSNAPVSSHTGDGLRLEGARITNAVKCWPPANKPLSAEIRTCNAYLAAELKALTQGTAVLALGRVAHEAVLRGLALPAAPYVFGHGAEHDLPAGLRLFDSYHCSRYNTQTKRLTEAMFVSVFRNIEAWLSPRRA